MRPAPLLLAVLLAARPLAAAQPAITIDSMFSDEGEAISAVVQAAWTTGGEVVFLDARLPRAGRTLERYQPGSSTRSPAVDAGVALASLRELVAAVAPDHLEWPPTLDAAGRFAVYAYAGDLLLLDFASSRFARLTATQAEEQAPRLAPDGRSLAFVRGHDLWLLDLASRAETRLTSDGSDTVRNGTPSWVYQEEILGRDDALWWASDSSAIAFLRSDEGAVAEMAFVDVQPDVPRVIRQRYPKAGGANPVVRLGIADLRSGRTAWLDPKAVAYEYILQVKWLEDGRSLGVLSLDRSQRRSDLWVVERATGAARRVLTETDPAWVNLVDFHFLDGGRQLLATSQRDGQTHLYRHGANGTLRNAVTHGPWSVRGPVNWQFSTLATTVDEAQGWAYFTARQPTLAERQLYRVGLDGKGQQRISLEPGSHTVVFSPDRRFYLDWHSSHRVSPSLSVHEASGASRTVLAPALAPAGLQYPELLTIPAPDGTPLQARLYRPAEFDPGRRYPVIVYVYGEPNAPAVVDEWRSWPPGNVLWEQVALQQGYLVAAVDPRSSTAATKAGENLIRGQVSGEVETADLVAAARWLGAQPFVDPARIGIWGWSGGGTATLMALTRSGEFAAGIAVAPVTDRRLYDTKYVEAYMGTPRDNPDGYAAVSLVERAKDLRGRLLLAFGTYDDNVHPQNALRFVDALVAAGKPFELQVYPMRKHDIADRAARRHLYAAMLAFWKRWL